MKKEIKNRKQTSFTLSADTIAKLGQYAKEHHTNKSQAVTNLIWAAYDDCPWPEHVPTEEDLDFMESLKYEVVATDDEGNVILSDRPWEWKGVN